MFEFSFFSFFMGIISTLVVLATAVGYAFVLTQRTVEVKVDELQRLVSRKKSEAASSTELDSIRLTSKIRFAVNDTDISRIRYGRITLIGTTITLFETVYFTDQKRINLDKEDPHDADGRLEEDVMETEAVIGKISTVGLEAKYHAFDVDKPPKDRLYPKRTMPGAVMTLVRPDSHNSPRSSPTASREGDSAIADAKTSSPQTSSKGVGVMVLPEGEGRGVTLASEPLLQVTQSATSSALRVSAETKGILSGGRLVFSAVQHEGNPSQWRHVTLKFATARELERSVSLLNQTPQTRLWRVFMKSVPQTDVFNILAARIFFESKDTYEIKRIITKKINKKLKTLDKKLPKHVTGGISVADISTGSELPLVSRISPLSKNVSGEIGFDTDVWYRGGFVLQLQLSFAYKETKIPDVLVKVVIKELKGRLHVSIGSPPSDKLWLGFYEPPMLALDFKQELAKNEKEEGVFAFLLRAVPDLSDVVSNLVRYQLFEDMTLPNLDDLPLPNCLDSPPDTPVDAPLKESFSTAAPGDYESVLSSDRPMGSSSGPSVVSNNSVTSLLNSGDHLGSMGTRTARSASTKPPEGSPLNSMSSQQSTSAISTIPRFGSPSRSGGRKD